jgi:hypothetical protein
LVPRIALASALLCLVTPVGAEQGSIAIELNKLEPQGRQCSAYFVINNTNGTNYQELKLDLVVFRPDGVIGRRFAIDLAPIKPSKRTVKLFELADTPCEEVGSFLINEVMECKGDAGAIDDCLKDITVSSRSKVQLTK